MVVVRVVGCCNSVSLSLMVVVLCCLMLLFKCRLVFAVAVHRGVLAAVIVMVVRSWRLVVNVRCCCMLLFAVVNCRLLLLSSSLMCWRYRC